MSNVLNNLFDQESPSNFWPDVFHPKCLNFAIAICQYETMVFDTLVIGPCIVYYYITDAQIRNLASDPSARLFGRVQVT